MNKFFKRAFVLCIISSLPLSGLVSANTDHHDSNKKSPKEDKVTQVVGQLLAAIEIRPPVIVVRPPVVVDRRPVERRAKERRGYRRGDVVRNIPHRAKRLFPRDLRSKKRGTGPYYVLRGRGGPTFFREVARGYRVVRDPTR